MNSSDSKAEAKQPNAPARRADVGKEHQEFSSGQINMLKGQWAHFDNKLPPSEVI